MRDLARSKAPEVSAGPFRAAWAIFAMASLFLEGGAAALEGEEPAKVAAMLAVLESTEGLEYVRNGKAS